MDKYIKRTTGGEPLWEILEKYHRREKEWETVKTVCVLEGLAGSGKTTYLLEYFKGKKAFYFSFAGLEEGLAEKLFADSVTVKTGVAVSGWEDSFAAVSQKHKYVILDDLTAISSYKRFHKAFYDCLITSIYTRPFVMLITQPTDDVGDLADKYDAISLDYFSVPEVMKLYPSISKIDILGLCALSGGVPRILDEYDCQRSLEDNLRNMLKPASAFCGFMPELLSRYFRKPECYHYILCAIAKGNHSVSGIGKFTGYAYNKCDNYLSALISCGFVKAEKAASKRGAEKTAYHLTNSYFRLWYLHIFKNRTALRLGDRKTVDGIIESIIGREIHEFHLQKAFALVNERINSIDLWSSFHITKIAYSPQTICKDGFSYTFDAITRNGEKAMFVKVFESSFDNCKKDELEKIREAMMLANTYYDSHVFIFSKRRFSDYAVKESAGDNAISLVEVERLKY